MRPRQDSLWQRGPAAQLCRPNCSPREEGRMPDGEGRMPAPNILSISVSCRRPCSGRSSLRMCRTTASGSAASSTAVQACGRAGCYISLTSLVPCSWPSGGRSSWCTCCRTASGSAHFTSSTFWTSCAWRGGRGERLRMGGRHPSPPYARCSAGIYDVKAFSSPSCSTASTAEASTLLRLRGLFSRLKPCALSINKNACDI